MVNNTDFETTSSLPINKNSELVILRPEGIGKITIEPIPPILGKEFVDLVPQIMLTTLESQPDTLRNQDTRVLLRKGIVSVPGTQKGGMLIDHGRSRGIVINLDPIEEIEEARILLNAQDVVAPPIIQALYILGHELSEQVWRYEQTVAGNPIQTIKLETADDVPTYHMMLHEQNADEGALNALEKVLGVKYKLEPDSKVVLYQK